MRLRSLSSAGACALAVLALTASSAGAATLGRTVLAGGNPAARAEYQAMIDGALPFAKQANVKVSFRESNCPGMGRQATACVIESRFVGGRMSFYIPRALRDPAKYNPVDLRNTVLHELGHVYDFQFGNDGHRRAFMKIFGLRGRFFVFDAVSPPFERFAVGYSYCAEGLTYEQALTRLVFDGYGHRFTAPQYLATCQLVKPPPVGVRKKQS